MSKKGNTINLPKNIYFETTNRCNLRCKGCILYKGSWEQDRDMSLNDLIMVTDQLPELERVVLHGIGEPLLNRELPLMIRHLKKRNVSVTFNSNGILLNEQWQNDLIDAGPDELRISLDAASQQVYRKIRNNSGFDQVIENIKSFLKLQKKRRMITPLLSLWFLGTKDNIFELPDFIRLSADIGVKEVHLQRLVYFQDDNGYGIARGGKTLWNTDDGSMEWIRKSQDLADALGIQFNASGLDKPIESLKQNSRVEMPWHRCYRPSTLMYITARGNVLPCCISPFSTMDYPSIILGNVFETSLEEIWTGDKYHHFRKKHQTGSPPKSCRSCGILWSL